MSQDYEKLGVLYLGRERESGQYLLYDSRDLLTHAVCVGMTGSGKTGLCIALLEEAAIDGIPALVVDPKGDLANLLLAFPDLRAEDFAPWVNEDEARAKGMDATQFASEQAGFWRDGLARWDQDGARIRRMQAACGFAIYTPGSDAGIPVSILSSFAAPDSELLDDREAYRDRLATTATSLLALAGIDADPVQSREHILLSNLFDAAWRNGEDLDLGALIGRVQQPPFQKIGVMDLESFYPARERFSLAMALNSLLASPGFSAWMEGEPLDVQSLLYTKEGKPRIAVVSIAHLGDTERMFFVSLLLNQVLQWVRRQSGTTSLRALLYMDEIFGYFPPVANPPSKKPLLTLLKQARAFGFGVVLATQNPVDLDYKGLANTGTWFIGRLQTERDKARVLEGLEGASAESGAKFDRARMEQTLAGLGNRVFLMNNVHEDAPVLFETRWTLSYLRGPLSRAQIRQLMAARKVASPAPSAPLASEKAAPAPGAEVSNVAPVLPPGIEQYFVPLTGAVLHYEPCVLGAAQVLFEDARLGLSEARPLVFASPVRDSAVPVDWTEAEPLDVPLEGLGKAPTEGATFAGLPIAAMNTKNYAAWRKQFATWLYQTQALELLKSPSTGTVARPGETEADFRIRLQQQAREARDARVAALRRQYAPRLQTLHDRLFRARQRLDQEKQQAQAQTMSSMASIGAGLLGAFLGRKTISAANVGRLGTAARSMSRIGKERAGVGRAEESLEALQQQLQDLESQLQAQITTLTAAINPATETLETVTLKPKKTNINVQLVALAWK
jgi:hypothetical protein